MDLNTIEAVFHPTCRASLPVWRSKDAFLAGGTWMFSEPQTGLQRLVDLTAMAWEPLRLDADGLEIAATCTLAELEEVSLPAGWHASPLIGQCCKALLGSFKIRNIATVGGNLCLALPAGPMAALLTALDGVCLIWTPDGAEREIPVRDFIIGASANALREGEVLRAIRVSAGALGYRTAFRQMSLTHLGRSAALLVGTRLADKMTLTITAAVEKPVQLIFDELPTRDSLMRRLDETVSTWYDDVHGVPGWRRRITHMLAVDIVSELAPS